MLKSFSFNDGKEDYLDPKTSDDITDEEIDETIKALKEFEKEQRKILLQLMQLK